MAMSVTETPTIENFVSPSQSSRKRRGPVNLGTTGSPRGLLLSVNDDEKERKDRRRSLHITRNILSPGGSGTPNANQSGQNNRDRLPSTCRTRVGMSNTQLKEHYSNCIKLSSENKINAKNAFGLHLIDYMKDLLKEAQNEDDTTNFQVASCTLDAGVKIYAGRVDSVHTDAHRMLENLGKKKNAQNEDQEEGVDADGNPQTKKETKRKKKNAGSTIEQNLKNINCDNYDFAFEVDPFFSKTSAAFDEGGTSGLMLNHLIIRDDSSELLLDSNCVPYFVKSPPPAEDSAKVADLTNFKDLLNNLLQDDIELCPQFSSFRFTGWDGTSEAFQDLKADSLHRFDSEAPAVEDAHEDDDGYQFNDDDDDCPQVFDPPEDGTLESRFQESLTLKDGTEARLVDPNSLRTDGSKSSGGTLCLELSLQPSEYSYFSDNFLKTWAGPNHWKLRSFAKDGKSKNDTSKKTTSKKEPFRINYDEEKDFTQQFAFSKAVTTLAISTIEKLKVENTTLHEDLHYDADDLYRLFLKPSIKVKRQFQATQLNDDDNSWYNYDNANDRNNFCPDLELGECDYDDDDVGVGTSQDMTCAFPDMTLNATRGLSNTPNNASRFAGDNLVPVPRKIEKIEIGYAKTAKRIDVKKVKRGIWNLLTLEELDQNKENIPGNKDSSSQSQMEPEGHVTGWHSFQNVYQELPTKLSHNAIKNLSVPIAFVCLLYLANEKELKIEGKDQLDDLMVTQESSLIMF